MIEINLLKTKKAFRLPVIIGIDLNLINYRALVFFVVIHIIVVPLSSSYFEDKAKIKEEELKKSTVLLDHLSKKEMDLASYSGMAEELSAKELQLKEKLELIKKVLKLKKNPYQMMLFIAKNIPNDIWLYELHFENEIITLKGQSKSYRSIGLFIDGLKKSIFFENSVRLEKSKTIVGQDNGNRSEEFEIVANIVRYN